jgi:hypothetical protein
MVTYIVIILLVVAILLLLGLGKEGLDLSSPQQRSKIALILMIAGLTLLALFSPEVRSRIEKLKQQLRL